MKRSRSRVTEIGTGADSRALRTSSCSTRRALSKCLRSVMSIMQPAKVIDPFAKSMRRKLSWIDRKAPDSPTRRYSRSCELPVVRAARPSI